MNFVRLKKIAKRIKLWQDSNTQSNQHLYVYVAAGSMVGSCCCTAVPSFVFHASDVYFRCPLIRAHTKHFPLHKNYTFLWKKDNTQNRLDYFILKRSWYYRIRSKRDFQHKRRVVEKLYIRKKSDCERNIFKGFNCS